MSDNVSLDILVNARNSYEKENVRLLATVAQNKVLIAKLSDVISIARGTPEESVERTETPRRSVRKRRVSMDQKVLWDRFLSTYGDVSAVSLSDAASVLGGPHKQVKQALWRGCKANGWRKIGAGSHSFWSAPLSQSSAA